MTDVNFPVSHPQYFGDLDSTSPQMRKLLKESDLIIGIGCSMFFDAFYSEEPTYVPGDLKVIHIHPDPWELGKNFPIDCGIQGDIKTTLAELISMLEKSVTEDYRREAEKTQSFDERGNRPDQGRA
jgi:benzoylformate decarboxylase